MNTQTFQLHPSASTPYSNYKNSPTSKAENHQKTEVTAHHPDNNTSSKRLRAKHKKTYHPRSFRHHPYHWRIQKSVKVATNVQINTIRKQYEDRVRKRLESEFQSLETATKNIKEDIESLRKEVNYIFLKKPSQMDIHQAFDLLDIDSNTFEDLITSEKEKILSAQYKKKARSFHPDKNRLPDATIKMQQINLAHSTLLETIEILKQMDS